MHAFNGLLKVQRNENMFSAIDCSTYGECKFVLGTISNSTVWCIDHYQFCKSGCHKVRSNNVFRLTVTVQYKTTPFQMTVIN